MTCARRGSLAIVAATCAALALGAVASAAPADAARKDVPASFTFDGAGWGHGVGLSQYGAYGMALDGASATEILEHYYTATTVAPVKDDVTLRVNLLHRVPEVAVRGEALEGGGGRVQVKLKGRPAVQVAPGERVRLVRKPAQVKVILRPAAGGKTVLGKAVAVAVRWAGTRAPGKTGTAASQLNVATGLAALTGSGHRYRYGMVKVWPSTGAGLEAVNFLRLQDEYLPGIAEVPWSWPAAVLQAQAVASRTYALNKLAAGVRKDCRCHMDDGGGPYYDQTFLGYPATGGPWVKAVERTAGLAVLYQGAPITAFYGSSTGGRTQASKDVWGGDLPYAQSVDDHWSLDPRVRNPNASWKVTVTQARLATLFGLPDVASVDLSDRTAGEALRTVTATSSTGKRKTISGPAFASGLGMKSRWVDKVEPSKAVAR